MGALEKIAHEKGMSTAQLAIACVLFRGRAIVPLIGARKRERLEEALGALDVTPTEGDLARLEQAVPAERVTGAR